MSLNNREFPMTDSNFSHIRDVAYQRTGIVLGDHKREMVYSRLARRCRVLGVRNFDEYILFLEQPESDELNHFVNAITTNLTSFFRESHHFDFLLETVLPEVFSSRQEMRRVRIWSAGCSTGEEPYSIAITLYKFLKKQGAKYRGWDVKILATDLDSNVVAHAKRGVYSGTSIDGLSDEDRVQFFDELDQENAGQLSVKEEIRQLITFNRLNLLHQWPMKGRFDVIFCRNVVIYFDKETQKVLFNRYADILHEPGYLMIGHSENLHRVTDRFKALGGTRYKKLS